MTQQTPNEFYADRGMIRTSITLDRPTVDTLADFSKALSNDDVKITQGDVVIILAELLLTNGEVKQAFNDRLKAFKQQKRKDREELREKKKKAKKLLLSGALDDLL